MFDVNAVAFKIVLTTTKNQCYLENLIIPCLAGFSYWKICGLYQYLKSQTIPPKWLIESPNI